MTRILIPAAILAACTWSTTTNAQVTLAHQFPDGAKSTNVTDVSTQQTLSIAGMEIVTGATQKVTVTTVNGKRGADGSIVVKQKIDAIKADLDIAGQQLSFDSANPDAPPPGTALDALLDLFKALSNSEWTVKHDRENRVVSVDGREKALASLPESLQKATARQYDSVYLAQVANDEMAAIPRHSITKGDTWELETAVRLEAGQTFHFKKTFQYEGTVQQDGKALHRISEKTTEVKYDMEADSPSPLKYVSSELKIADSKGTTLFDNQLGAIVSRHSKIQITGPMTFEAGGNELPATVDLTMEQSTKTLQP